MRPAAATPAIEPSVSDSTVPSAASDVVSTEHIGPQLHIDDEAKKLTAASGDMREGSLGLSQAHDLASGEAQVTFHHLSLDFFLNSF